MFHFDPHQLTVIGSIDGKFSFAISNILEPEASGKRFTYLDGDSGLARFFARLAD
jgi:hypothetical protein